MSLTSSLSSALSGLNAASRAVEIVSSNVANAMTDGYARREVNLASETVGGNGAGVKFVGVTRVVNERALADQRQATANMSNSAAQADSWLRIETTIGYPTQEGSLSARIDQLESSLIQAASGPEDTVRLENAVYAAASVVESIQSIESEIQEMRMDADADIDTMVQQLNGTLEQVQSLNWQIYRMGNGGQDIAALMDQRQQLVDSISEIIPVQQIEREGNQVALFTPGGASLIDGPAAELSFSPTGMIVPEMTLEKGLLSGLELNGQPLSLDSTYGSIEGGLLSAAFDTRDRIATEAQAGIDALARDLIERFQDTSLDGTLGPGDGGLFTDRLGAFDSADEVGISGRISVNPAVDPDSGGEARRLRDGIGSMVAGDVGDSTLITALAERLATQRFPASGPSEGLARSVSALASDFLSTTDANYRIQEQAQVFHSARVDALTYEVAEDSVNTDEEMQKLLLIEQAYSANAQVIRTIDELMQQLLEL